MSPPPLTFKLVRHVYYRRDTAGVAVTGPSAKAQGAREGRGPCGYQYPRQLCRLDTQKPESFAPYHGYEPLAKYPVADSYHPHHNSVHRYLRPLHAQDAMADIHLECRLLLYYWYR